LLLYPNWQDLGAQIQAWLLDLKMKNIVAMEPMISIAHIMVMIVF